MNTNVRTHLRRRKHGKSIVRRHIRHVQGRKAFINPFMKKNIQEGLSKKSVYNVSNDNLLNSARNLFDRGEISLEQMGEIERRANAYPPTLPDYSPHERMRRSKEVLDRLEGEAWHKKLENDKSMRLELEEGGIHEMGPRYIIKYGPNGRPSGVRKMW